jgi:tetratricopeptide (TPR) repeat protein
LTLHELLTLRPAFEESDRAALIRRIAHEEPAPPRKWDRRVPRDLETIVLKAIAREPARRYQSAAALAEDLRRFLADRPVRARRSSGSEKAWRWCRRNPALASLTALLVLTFFAGFAAVTWKWREAEKARTQEQRTRAIADERGEEIREGLERLKAANALLDRGRWYVMWHRWDDAHLAFTKALELRPDHGSVCVERSDLCALLGLWDLAAEDYTREFALHEPDTAVRWYRHALLRLHLGDVEDYRQLRRRMRARFGGTLNSVFATELVRTSLLAPEAAADSARLLREAEILAAADPASLYHRYLLGIAHYRAGNPAAAIVRLRQSLGSNTETWNLRLMNYPILAMAHHRLRQSAEARQALNQAARTVDQWTQERYQTQGDSWVIDRGATAIWPVAWWDWLECMNYYREAKLLIDGSPPPPEPRLQVLRARSFAGLRWPLQADAEYTAVLHSRPDDPQIRFEARINRAQSFIHLHQWGRAANELAGAIELRPDVTSTWCHRAMALLADGDRAGYRHCCESMLQRFHQTENPRTASDVLLACAASDGALGDVTRLLPLTRIAAPGWHLGYHARAAGLYRAGKYAEAVRCCEAAAQTYRPRAWDWCFLAMAHQRLGHEREARRCLAEAAAWIDQADREALDELTATRPAWGDWHGPVIYRLLFQEAKDLVEGAD